MHNIVIQHTNSHNFIVTVDSVPTPLSYRNFGGRKAVDALGEDGLTQLINKTEQVIQSKRYNEGCQAFFKGVGVSNAMALLELCCSKDFCSYWRALVHQRKQLGQGYSFRNVLTAVSGTKATLAQSSNPLVDQLKTICQEAQEFVLPANKSMVFDEVIDGNIRVAFCGQVNNSIIYEINGQKVSLCTNRINTIRTSKDVLHAAHVLQEAIFFQKSLEGYVTHWGGSFVFRILHALCPKQTVDYFGNYAQTHIENRILINPRKTLKDLCFPFNDHSLSSFCHEILSVLEQHRFAAGAVLTAGNFHTIRSSEKSWTLYFKNNLTAHYRKIDFSKIYHRGLREEAILFLRAYSVATGEVSTQQVARYFYLLCSGLNALGTAGAGSIKDTTLSHVRFVKSHLDRSRSCSPNHISEVLQVLGRMYHWAFSNDSEKLNPFWRVSIPNKTAFLRTTSPASSAALRLISTHLDELPEQVQLGHELLLLTLSRAYDAFHVRTSDLEFFEDGTGRLRFQASKNHRRMMFHIPVTLASHLKTYVKKTEILREHSGNDYVLLYSPTGIHSNSACMPRLLTYETYNYYIGRLIARYSASHQITTRSIRAEGGRRYHSAGMPSSYVSIALGNTPKVAKKHYRTLSPRDEAELYHRLYTETFTLAQESKKTTLPQPMWGSCNSIECQHPNDCQACPFLYTSEVNVYGPCTKIS